MKNLVLLLLVVLAAGCGQRSPYDVSADQVKRRVMKGGSLPDLEHLPPGAIKNVKTFKKGETLPDGSIAKGNERVMTVTVNKTEP